MIAPVAGEDLMGEGKTVTIEHEADDELLAIGTVITRMSEFGFGRPTISQLDKQAVR